MRCGEGASRCEYIADEAAAMSSIDDPHAATILTSAHDRDSLDDVSDFATAVAMPEESLVERCHDVRSCFTATSTGTPRHTFFSRTCSGAVRPNFTLKLVRPGFGPAAELPTLLPVRWRHAGCRSRRAASAQSPQPARPRRLRHVGLSCTAWREIR
jgi:hypothetical protein